MSDLPPTRDTNLGGQRRDFPSTCWSRISMGPGGKDAEAAVGELALHYWKPIYAFIRTRWSKSNEDAKDLAQEFFAWMIESDFLSKADPRRGRFRVFVKAALEYFLSNEARDAHRLKRGGGRSFFTLGDSPDDTLAANLPSAKQRTPDEILDDLWRSGLLIRAEARLEELLRREKREVAFGIFRDYCLSGSGEVNYRDLAEHHRVTEGDVLVHLRHARKRFRSILTDLVAETVQGSDDLAEELRTLFGEEPA